MVKLGKFNIIFFTTTEKYIYVKYIYWVSTVCQALCLIVGIITDMVAALQRYHKVNPEVYT